MCRDRLQGIRNAIIKNSRTVITPHFSIWQLFKRFSKRNPFDRHRWLWTHVVRVVGAVLRLFCPLHTTRDHTKPRMILIEIGSGNGGSWVEVVEVLEKGNRSWWSPHLPLNPWLSDYVLNAPRMRRFTANSKIKSVKKLAKTKKLKQNKNTFSPLIPVLHHINIICCRFALIKKLYLGITQTNKKTTQCTTIHVDK